MQSANSNNATIQKARCSVCNRLLVILQNGKITKHGPRFQPCSGSYLFPSNATNFTENENGEPVSSSNVNSNIPMTEIRAATDLITSEYVNERPTFENSIYESYERLTTWRRNLFQLPKGNIGKEFIRELTKQINHWSSKSSLRHISLKCAMVMPSLLLQQVSVKSKSSENKNTLERRLSLWRDGKINELLLECIAIQSRLETMRIKPQQDITKTFHKMMIHGRVNAAIRLLRNAENKGILPLNQSTVHELKLKHPNASMLNDEIILQGPIKYVNPVIFESITEDVICESALNIKGAAGVSQLHADDWRRLIGSKVYGNEGIELRRAIATMIKQLCTEEISDPESLEALLACRLIPLSKDPGVRPIGIGEVLRRIMAKSVLKVLRKDILFAAGNLQLCAGQKSGCEVAIHSAVDLFDEAENHGILQIDAKNAFNSINRKMAVYNLKILCPEFATYVSNSYAYPARLFITGGLELSSNEGTTQGDPIAMPMYALSIIPLLDLKLDPSNESAKKIAFADDFTGIGTVSQLKSWWDTINAIGPFIGYYPNASKSVVIVKQEHFPDAEQAFSGSDVNISSTGNKHL